MLMVFSPRIPPSGTMMGNPIVSGRIETDIPPGTFREKPLVPQNFLPFRQRFPKKAGLLSNQARKGIRHLSAGKATCLFLCVKRGHVKSAIMFIPVRLATQISETKPELRASL